MTPISTPRLGLVALIAFVGLTGCSLFRPAMRGADELTIERTPARVARGEHLATHIMACLQCHSPLDPATETPVAGKLGAGGRVFGPEMDFPGTVVSSNLTPDAETGLGTWSDGEVLRAMREGVSKDGHALFPIMPYPNYHGMSDEDAYAIVAYLRTLKPVRNAVPERKLNFPLNVLVNTMPQPLEGAVGPAPTERVAKGGYLLKMASCAECHTPMDKGAPVAGKTLAGGHTFKFGSADGRVEAIVIPNITQDKRTGIGAWTDRQIEDAIRVGVRPDGRRLSPHMPYPAYQGMSADEMAALIAFLRTVPAIDNPDGGQ